MQTYPRKKKLERIPTSNKKTEAIVSFNFKQAREFIKLFTVFLRWIMTENKLKIGYVNVYRVDNMYIVLRNICIAFNIHIIYVGRTSKPVQCYTYSIFVYR